MSKRSFKCALIVCFVFLLSFPNFAEAVDPGISPEAAAHKLVRGLENLTGSLVEVPSAMMRRSRNDGVFAGLTLGTVEGVMHTVKRALAGIWEVATFPVPVPENYEPIIARPDFSILK